jgi:hypothetical protein
MKNLIFALIVSLHLPLARAQNVTAPKANDAPYYTNQGPNFPLGERELDRIRKAQPDKRIPQYLYGTDVLQLSNYGQPGVLIMGLGDEFNGVVAYFMVCHIWAIDGLSGTINWGDGTPPTPMFFITPLSSHQAGTIKTPQQIGTFQVSATINGLCGDWWRHGDVPNSVQGKATAYVYDSLPITTFQVNCGTTPNCTTIQGGQTASGLVTTQTGSPSSMGTLVRIMVTGPGTAIPYVIEPTNQTTVPFTIPTSAVTANTTMVVSVYSGGTTLSQTITVTP